MAEVGRLDEHAIALADIDEVNFEQRASAERVVVDPADGVAAAGADFGAVGMLLKDFHAVAPKQVAARVFGVGLVAKDRSGIGRDKVVEGIVDHLRLVSVEDSFSAQSVTSRDCGRACDS